MNPKSKMTFREKLEEILDAFDKSLTEENPDDEEYEVIKEEFLDKIISLIESDVVGKDEDTKIRTDWLKKERRK